MGPRLDCRPNRDYLAAHAQGAVQNIREVKAKLSQIVSELSEEGSVVITKNGRPCAVLMPVTDDTDLEAVALSQNRTFWRLYDHALAKVDEEGWTPLGEV